MKAVCISMRFTMVTITHKFIRLFSFLLPLFAFPALYRCCRSLLNASGMSEWNHVKPLKLVFASKGSLLHTIHNHYTFFLTTRNIWEIDWLPDSNIVGTQHHLPSTTTATTTPSSSSSLYFYHLNHCSRLAHRLARFFRLARKVVSRYINYQTLTSLMTFVVKVAILYTIPWLVRNRNWWWLLSVSYVTKQTSTRITTLSLLLLLLLLSVALPVLVLLLAVESLD